MRFAFREMQDFILFLTPCVKPNLLLCSPFCLSDEKRLLTKEPFHALAESNPFFLPKGRSHSFEAEELFG
jgi:hypothetical protein